MCGIISDLPIEVVTFCLQGFVPVISVGGEQESCCVSFGMSLFA